MQAPAQGNHILRIVASWDRPSRLPAHPCAFARSSLAALCIAASVACGGSSGSPASLRDGDAAGDAGPRGAGAGGGGDLGDVRDGGSTNDAGTTAARVDADGVRICDFSPGQSQPAEIAPALLDEQPPEPAVEPPIEPTAVSASTTERQLETFGGLRAAVADHYVDPTFAGKDWTAITTAYEALVSGGLSDEDFARAMQQMLDELGDEHSYFQSADDVLDEAARVSRGQSFVGVGFLALPVGDLTTASIIALWPGGSAVEAGLRVHDRLIAVDGLPPRDEHGVSRTIGPEGTSFELTYQRPGEETAKVMLARRAVTGPIPVDYCLFPGTRIGYLLVPTFLDGSIADQVEDAYRHMSRGGRLTGLVFDNRMNGGGLGSVAQATLELFLDGEQGRYLTRTESDPLVLSGRDVEGSQAVSLVVLIDRDTASYGEIFGGVLQVAGRATLVGGRTAGNVEQLRAFDFSDGSRAWLAAATYEPRDLTAGAWEGQGLAPDVEAPTRWDHFTEATDPALARALERLQ